MPEGMVRDMHKRMPEKGNAMKQEDKAKQYEVEIAAIQKYCKKMCANRLMERSVAKCPEKNCPLWHYRCKSVVIEQEKLSKKEIKERRAILRARKESFPKPKIRKASEFAVKLVKNPMPLPPKELLTVAGIKKQKRVPRDFVGAAMRK